VGIPGLRIHFPTTQLRPPLHGTAADERQIFEAGWIQSTGDLKIVLAGHDRQEKWADENFRPS
jgi:hypothetical protein